jgi:hypothetical protein
VSIYGTFFCLDGEGDEHSRDCEKYIETAPDCFEQSGKLCSCGAWRNQPIVYEGSHVLPSDDDRRGGTIELAEIPQHIAREGRNDAPEGALKDWLRLGVWSGESTEQHNGAPYVAAGDATVILTREHVTELRDALTGWLEREVYDEAAELAEIRSVFGEGR